jgi:hypothetical protein
MRRLIAAALASVLYIPASAQSPNAEDQKHAINAARDLAIRYTGHLPDFICTKQVQTTDRTSPTNIKINRLTIQLSYFGQKEKQKLVALNGKATQQPLESLDSFISGGEFGNLLIGIFDPSASAHFEWKGPAIVRKRAVSVYTYRIARANSKYMIGGRQADGKLGAEPAGYHGEIALDKQTENVLRLTASADDLPKDTAITLSSVEVDYDFANVGDKSYLLPARSEAHMQRDVHNISSVVTFVGYQKFSADSSISFK